MPELAPVTRAFCPRSTLRGCPESSPVFAIRRPSCICCACMKLATFNVNGIGSRLPHLLQWLEREAPDIVCLQELKVADTRFPAAQIRDAGYGVIWQGQKPLWNGVAILARGTDP